jgi:hypothetical protein
MPVSKSRPRIPKKDGKPLFVVLPYAEYQRLRGAIEDLHDRLLIAKAEIEDRGRPYHTLDEVKARFGIPNTKASTGSRRRKTRRA